MTNATADWSRAYRRRKRAGLSCFELELPEVETVEALRSAGFLTMDEPTNADICAALQRAIVLWIEDENENAS